MEIIDREYQYTQSIATEIMSTGLVKSIKDKSFLNGIIKNGTCRNSHICRLVDLCTQFNIEHKFKLITDPEALKLIPKSVVKSGRVYGVPIVEASVFNYDYSELLDFLITPNPK